MLHDIDYVVVVDDVVVDVVDVVVVVATLCL